MAGRHTRRHKWIVSGARKGMSDAAIRAAAAQADHSFAVALHKLSPQDQRNVLGALRDFMGVHYINIKSACELVKKLGIFFVEKE